MKVIAIDFDNTITETSIGIVNDLFENKNNFIVIYTSRSKTIRTKTENELSQLKVKYHALVMEKLRADVYIDDKNSGGLNFNI